MRSEQAPQSDGVGAEGLKLIAYDIEIATSASGGLAMTYDISG
jgi:hypothetical protein